ncbi:MAG: hypothetical protein AVDCRST_MAG70-453 [uncultured Thermomicrobiales bacterium]|uniref:Calcineurin-like phosphoesterase domain-containing protein n=1 Tax=uncultured Thermomicrobiales bacterium TaxID=1645740 RepID=A0A6J4UD47_9BACT|nr:MAG: hypothetical protein AVDCRST_MAG70-453 [uncultured Thermomicrobiales bacterium]
MWTRRVASAGTKGYLRSLLPEIRFEVEGVRFRLVHGSPRRMNEYLFEDRDPRSLARIAQTADCDVLVFGHTHKPWIREIEGVLMINAGSVGKLKDGDPRAAWVSIDIASGRPVDFTPNPASRDPWHLVDIGDGKPASVGIVRVPYDVGAMAEAIRAADGLPRPVRAGHRDGWPPLTASGVRWRRDASASSPSRFPAAEPIVDGAGVRAEGRPSYGSMRPGPTSRPATVRDRSRPARVKNW